MRRGHIIHRQRIGSGVGYALGATFVLGINEVRANSLNLIENVLFAGKADGNHQD